MKTFKQLKQKAFLVVLMLAVLFLNAQAGEKQEINKTFKPKELVKIHTVSGDCVIKKGKSSEIRVNLVHTYSTDEFEPIFEEEGNTLILKEKFHHKSKWGWNHKGKSTWTVIAPEKTNIEFSSASGDLDAAGLKSSISARAASGDITVKNFKGKLKVKAASGDIEVKQSGGEISVKAASGDIELSDAAGAFSVKTASGDIKAAGIHFTAASDFKSASGDILVELSKSNDSDLKFATASGNITLVYNGNPVKGYFVFKGMKGNISSEIPFDNKEKSHQYSPFVKKFFKKGGDSPEISLKTVSGKLTFKK